MRDENVVKCGRLKAQTVVKAVNTRNMHGYYAETKEEALKIALNIIPRGSSVGYGGGVSVDQIGLKDALLNGDYKLIRREEAKTPEEMHDKYREIFDADFFITGANAMTEDGTRYDAEGEMPGYIAREPKGRQGFGYDPIFYLPELGKTSGELTEEEKNAISHRGKVLRKMKGILEQEGILRLKQSR